MKRFQICSLLIVMTLVGACAVTNHTTENEFELSFWFREGAKEDDSRIIAIRGHCCCSGRIAAARVSRMPSFDRSEALEVELVVELSDQGMILRRWGMPVNSIVAAISGTQIIVSEAEGRGLSISESGNLAMTALPRDTGYGKLVDCPPIKEFEGSAYLRCFELRDLKSGESRRIAYEGPCT